MYKSSKRPRLDLNDDEFGSAQSILNDSGLIKQLVLFNKQPSSSNGEESSQSPATPQSVQPPDIEIIEQEEEINNVVTSPFLDNTNNNNDPILVSRQESITNEQVAYINQEWLQHFDVIVRSNVYASEIIDLVKSASKDLDLALASLNSYFDRNSNRVDFADMEYRTPLMHSSHVEVTQLLIDKGANVNLRDANGRTAIMYAPNAQIARVLIANRADLNFRDSNGQTALMHAINRPHPQLKSTTNSEHYLNTYARNYSATNSDQNKQERLMSVYDRTELIRLLVRSVTTHNINLFDKSYSNALLLAVKANDIDTVRMLVPYGADINSVDQFERTPLMHAVLLNNLDIVRLLIDNNANVNQIDKVYKSTLLYAFESCPKVCSDSCTCHSLNPTSRLQRALNKSILDEIIEKSSIEMINYKDPNDQKPPLIHAVLLNDVATVQALIRRGAFVNQTDQWRNTPLIYAILRKQTKIVQVLLENNADVNAVGFAEKTPLMLVYNLEKTQSSKAPTIQQYHQHLQQQEQQQQVEPVQQQTNRGRGRGRGRPRLITQVPTIPQPTPQYSTFFSQSSQNQETKTKIYELAETILRHCSRQAESIGVCTLLNLDLTGDESKTVVNYVSETGDKRNMQTLMYYSIGSVYDYFYSSTPDMIRAQVNKYIESVRPRQACQIIAADNSSSLLFPLQNAHFQLFETLILSHCIDSNLEDDAQFHNFCLEYYYLIYFISADFQEKLLSDVMIRLSEDLIEIDKFTTLDAKRNSLITDDIVIEEESNEINTFANDLKAKREIVEGIFNKITSFTPVILKMANWLIKPAVPFESSLSDEYSLECEKFLKTRPFSKNLF